MGFPDFEYRFTHRWKPYFFIIIFMNHEIMGAYNVFIKEGSSWIYPLFITALFHCLS